MRKKGEVKEKAGRKCTTLINNKVSVIVTHCMFSLEYVQSGLSVIPVFTANLSVIIRVRL